MSTNANRNGFFLWWMAPNGGLRPCAEHEFAARSILRELKLIPNTGRAVFDQMFNHGWIRVVLEKACIYYQTSRSLSQEANDDQLRALKALALERGVELCCIK